MFVRSLFTLLVAVVLLSGLAASLVAAEPEPIEREYFTYYLDNPRFLETTDSALTYARLRLMDILEDTLTYKPSIYIVGDIKQFNKLIRGRFPDWGAAAAFAERKLIAIKSPDKFNLGKSLEELLVHEYAHLAVSHKTGLHSAPRWLHEGIAMFASMEWSWLKSSCAKGVVGGPSVTMAFQSASKVAPELGSRKGLTG